MERDKKKFTAIHKMHVIHECRNINVFKPLCSQVVNLIVDVSDNF